MVHYTLTPEQQAVYEAAVKLPRRQQTIGGYAGTGKTVLVPKFVQAFPSFKVCAFTGKAAHVLKDRGVEATTIHSRIYNLLKDKDNKPLLKDGKPQFVRKSHLDCGGFIIDEASMIDAQLYRDLTSFGLPIIFLGDHGQLEPVGEDIYLMKNPDYRLEKVHRNAGEIQRFSVHVRNGGEPGA
jgi:exodeoxyribonuclease-5